MMQITPTPEYYCAVGGGLAFPTKTGAIEMAKDLSAHVKDSLFTVYREPDSFLVLAGVMQGAGTTRSIAKFINGRRL